MYSFQRTLLQAHRGLSILEVVVSIGIFTLLIASIVGIYLSSNRARTQVWDELNAQNEGRRFLRDFLGEVRAAVPSATGAYALERATDQELIFFSNIDADALRERVRYFIINGTLKKGIIKPTGNPPTYILANEKLCKNIITKHMPYPSSIIAFHVRKFNYLQVSVLHLNTS